MFSFEFVFSPFLFSGGNRVVGAPYGPFDVKGAPKSGRVLVTGPPKVHAI